MPYYAQEFKEKTTRQLLPPHSRSVASVSRETGVSEPTLYAWKKLFGQQAQPAAPDGRARSCNAKARLNAVIATAAMNELERSAWCREQGLYVHELDGFPFCRLGSFSGAAFCRALLLVVLLSASVVLLSSYRISLNKKWRRISRTTANNK